MTEFHRRYCAGVSPKVMAPVIGKCGAKKSAIARRRFVPLVAFSFPSVTGSKSSRCDTIRDISHVYVREPKNPSVSPGPATRRTVDAPDAVGTRCRFALNPGLPHFVWSSADLIGIIRALRSSEPARPYIARLIVFSRLI